MVVVVVGRLQSPGARARELDRAMLFRKEKAKEKRERPELYSKEKESPKRAGENLDVKAT